MSYDPSPATEALLARYRDLLHDTVLPLEPRLLAEGFAAVEGDLEEARATVRERGLWAPHLPVEEGGLGLSIFDLAHVAQVLGQSPLGLYCVNTQAPDVGNMELLLHAATPDQKARFFDPLARGEIRSCFTMTEPEFAGSNPVLLGTTAVRDGDDYVIDGHKWFASSAEGAAFAIAMVVTDPAAAPHARASMILVPTDTPGFEIVRNLPVMGDAGSGWASHAEVRYTACRVPVANRLGPEGAGFALAQARLGPGRIHHCMRWIGLAERAFDLLCRRAADRELAPGRPLGTRQTVQTWIAESRAEIDAARLLVLDTAWRIDREGAHGARVAISAIKYLVPDVMLRVVDRAIQAHGGLGVLDDLVLSWIYRHERAARIYDGPDEVHKEVVARRVLRDYGLDLGRR